MNIKELRELIAEYDRAKIERARFGQADAPADVTQALADAERAIDDLADGSDEDGDVDFLRILVDFDRRLETLESSRLLWDAVSAQAVGRERRAATDAAGH